jgi:hypothetical protein
VEKIVDDWRDSCSVAMGIICTQHVIDRVLELDMLYQRNALECVGDILFRTSLCGGIICG